MKQKQRFFFLLATLSFIAGFINVYTITHFSMSSSHLTGDLSRLSLSLAQADSQLIGRFLTVITAFFIGSVLSGFLFANKPFFKRRRYGYLFLSMGVFLAVTPHLFGESELMVWGLACLLGLQNGLVITYQGVLLRTTHFTGYITDLGVLVGLWLNRGSIPHWKCRIYVLGIVSFSVGGMLSSILGAVHFQGIFLMLGALYCLAGGIYLRYLCE